MKSVRLTNDMRRTIVTSIMDQWEESNPLPVILTEEQFADAMWEETYGKLPLDKIPTRLLNRTNGIRIQPENGNYLYIGMSTPRPVARHTTDAVIPDDHPLLLEYQAGKVVVKDWKDKFDAFKEEVQQIIQSVNTTKQLLEAWPEVEEHLPGYIRNPSNIKLPAIKVEHLNEALKNGKS